MKRKIPAILIVMALLVGIIAGCSSADDPAPPAPPQDSADSGTSTNDTGTGDAPAAPGGLTDNGVPVSEPGQMPVALEPVTLSALIRQESYLLDIRENVFTKDIQEMTNVNLDLTVVPGDSYDERRNLLLTSGDYPELILSGAGDLNQFGVREQIYIPLNDLIAEHGYFIKQRWAENQFIESDMKLIDGNIYGIPALDNGGWGHTQATYKAWGNKAWMDTLGIDMPTTTEDFHNMLRAFKEQDPNGNGIADEVPMTGAINTWNGEIYKFLLNSFGYFDDWNMFHLKGNTVTSMLDQDYIRDGLAWIAEMYSEGLIDPACLAQSETEMSALGTNPGDAIVGVASAGHLGMFIDINDIERSSMYTAMLPLQGPNGYRGIFYNQNSRVSGGMFAITDKCQYPVIALKFADLFCSEEIIMRTQYGVKGVHWDDADPGTFAFDGVTPAKYKTLEFSSGVADLDDWKWGWTMRLLEMDVRNMFQLDGNIYDPLNYEGRLFVETIKLLPYAADVDSVPPLIMDSDTTARYDQIRTQVRDYMATYFSEVIMGKQDINSTWSDYLNSLEGLGYSEYIQITKDSLPG